MVAQVEKWDFAEISFTHPAQGNPFVEVSFSAVFTHPEQEPRAVPGFYDGDGVFKLRFMPDQEGLWRYETRSNLPALNGQTGELRCLPPSAGNHGPVRVANTYHFAFADGTPYVPVGTTCYVWNLQGDALEERTLQTLDTAPFNKMRMCVFPKRYSFNLNEPPSYPFPGEVQRDPQAAATWSFTSRQTPPEWDFSRFNPAYFRHLEQRILDLRQRGIEADLIIFHPYDSGAWGFDHLSPEVNDRYLRYLVARLSAFRNLWWSFANEYDLFPERSMADWDHYFQLVAQEDPYHHLRSIHNCGSFYDHTKAWVTHCSVQNGVIPRVPAWRKMYQKPVVIDECGYEGNIHMSWGDLSPEEMLNRFWLGFTLGGYVGHGETYVNDEEVLWWSKGGELTGQSVPRIAFLRQVFEAAPELTPVEKVDLEQVNLMNGGIHGMFSDLLKNHDPLAAAGFGAEACGYNTAQGYYLFYYGLHQPAAQRINLQDGCYQVDVIDAWNMTVETVMPRASGEVVVHLPGRKFIAIRITRQA